MPIQPVQKVTFACGHSQCYTDRDLIRHTSPGKVHYSDEPGNWKVVPALWSVTQGEGPNQWASDSDCAHCRRGMAGGKGILARTLAAVAVLAGGL